MSSSDYTLIATADTRDGMTTISIWSAPGLHRGRRQTVFLVDFVHKLENPADRRSVTWTTKPTEAEARAAANACFRRWNG